VLSPDEGESTPHWSLFMSNGVEMLSKDGKQPAFNTPEDIEVFRWQALSLQGRGRG
jgi:hypothetical protein